jgi:hormone-sensitive lipase
MEFKLINEDIKFPTFNNKKFEELLKQPINKEIAIKDFKSLIDNMNLFIQNYIKIIKENINDFNNYLNSYNKRSYDYLMIAKSILYLISIISDKISNEETKSKYKISYNDLLNDNEFKSIISNQYLNEDSKNKVNEIVNKLILNDCEYLLSTNNNFGFIFMDICIKFILLIVENLNELINKFINIKDFNNSKLKSDNEIIIFDIVKILEQLETFDLILIQTYNVPDSDICNLEESSNDWKNLKKIIFRVIPNNEEEIKKGFEDWKNQIDYVMSVFENGFKSNSIVKNVFSSIGIGLKYKFNKKDFDYDSKKLKINNNSDFMIKMCSLTLNKYYKKMTGMKFPKIEFRKKLYLKRNEPEITIKYIKSLLEKMGIKPSNENDIKNLNDDINNNPVIETENIPKELFYEKLEKNNKKYFVSTRLLNYKKIRFTNESESFSLFFKPEKQEIIDTIFIHIHGGGFVGTTTFNHEEYLRAWANRLKIPILGVNYGLSPEFQYPKALDDCFQAYMWIIKNAKSQLNIDPKHVILSGDSAGGNLCLGLLFLIIAMNVYNEKKIQLPELVLPQYPCSNTSVNNFSISMLLALTDFMLNDKFLKYCNKSYRGNYPNDNDPFLNPNMVNDEILKLLPKTRMIFGTCDPLRDDTIRLLYKISKVPNLDCKAYELKYYAHGFFGLKDPKLIKNPTDILLNEVEEFIKNNKK